MPKPKRTATLTAPPFAGQPDDSWLLLDSQMCFALYSASLSMTKIYKPALAKHMVKRVAARVSPR